MKFVPPLVKATLLKRYKRFLADVEINGSAITVHCPNTGSMRNCLVEGSECWLWDAQNPKRKYRYGLELVTTTTGDLAGINTLRANPLVEEAILAGRIPELSGCQNLKREVKYGESSRIDFLLTAAPREQDTLHRQDAVEDKVYVEVKSVTLCVGEGRGLFPDAVSARALKHVRELMRVRANGDRAVLLFCVQHSGIDRVSPADDVDPAYGKALREAYEAGVEVLAYRAAAQTDGMTLIDKLPVVL